MTPAALLGLLQEFYGGTLDLVQDRQVSARSVTGYSANNVHQQVLGRQDVHLQWLADAIAALGGDTPTPGQPQDGAVGTKGASAQALVETDIRNQLTFIQRWTPRLETITNARHRKLLELVLGEMKEHLRALEQAQEGRTDALGRDAKGKVARGEVMAARPKN